MVSETIKILLIEDNPDALEFLREELFEAAPGKIELECAERLAKGLERLSGGDFDVVLLDISLPDSHGFDTFENVHNCASEIPIIVLTNFDNDRFAIKAVQEGAQDYLIKGSVGGESLIRSIRYAIERHQKLKEFKPTQAQKSSSFFKFWKNIKPSSDTKQKEVLDDIYSSEHFRVIVERERSRADRDGHGFSLVVFDIESTANSISAEYLRHVGFSRRLSPTDEIGWFDKRNIGVLLHNTSVEGAWSFCNYVRDIIAAKGPPPDCSVYAYPSDKLEVVSGISIKRKEERFDVQAQSTVFLKDKGPQELKEDLLTTNISTGGLFLKTTYPLPIGTSLDINLVVPIDKLKKLEGDRALIKVSGSVVRANEDGMAIRFDKECDIIALTE